MRITQALATKAANLLTAKTAQAIEVLSNEIDTLALDEYFKSLPKGVTAFDKANPGWVTKEDDLRVNYKWGGVIHTYYANAGVSVPVKNGYAKVTATKALRAKIIRLEEMREKFRTLKKETYAVVLNLGTSRLVLKAFPETAELFGANITGQPAPVNANILRVKSQLQKQ